MWSAPITVRFISVISSLHNLATFDGYCRWSENDIVVLSLWQFSNASFSVVWQLVIFNDSGCYGNYSFICCLWKKFISSYIGFDRFAKIEIHSRNIFMTVSFGRISFLIVNHTTRSFSQRGLLLVLLFLIKHYFDHSNAHSLQNIFSSRINRRALKKSYIESECSIELGTEKWR